jgi:hypothetical protein
LNGTKSKIVRLELMLRRLVYTSRSLIGSDPRDVEAILASSNRRNAEVALTGMLWVHGDGFAQVIEGDPDNIRRAMDRIRRDHRHTDIAILLDRQVSSRQFGSWSMRRASDDEASAYGTTFMIGFALGERTAAARRLYEIVVASDG